jgi:hypothetical protein
MMRFLGLACLCTYSVTAQQVRAEAPPGMRAVIEQANPAAEDPGVRVEMFDNDTLNRYLERSHAFLIREDYDSAVDLLQNIIDGRLGEVFSVELGEDDGLGVEKGGVSSESEVKLNSGAMQPEAKSDAKDKPEHAPESSLFDSVYSQDGRLFRPARRLCIELLARMPDVGVQIYRAKYEVVAQELLTEAIRSDSTAMLEEVVNRYFITVPAGRAMKLLADQNMTEGRYRTAIQLYRDLLDVFPVKNRQSLGIKASWCQFKIALCFKLAGESRAARAVIEQLAIDHEEESLRILGELESIRDLPGGAVFSREAETITQSRDSSAFGSWLDSQDLGLIPLWQYRFATADPYMNPKPKKRSQNILWGGSERGSTVMPLPRRYSPGTTVAFTKQRDGENLVPRALFLEHYRLRVADTASGVQLKQTDEAVSPSTARVGHPRIRIAASDFALLRPVEDANNTYVVIGHDRSTVASTEVLASSELVAYDKTTLLPRWSSRDWLDGPGGLRDVTFLAAPTVFGSRLLLPGLRKGVYTLECLDSATGRPIYRKSLHSGGSQFFKAPGCPVALQGSLAIVATNAGCIAAVDGLVGDLRWIRRYERRDAKHLVARKGKRINKADVRRSSTLFLQSALNNFLPCDLITHKGLVIFAPCDGEIIIAVDGRTGQPVWRLDGRSRYAPFNRLTKIVGHNDELMFATSETHLVCIELSGGLIRWASQLPQLGSLRESGRGRGLVSGSSVVIPNGRELLLFDVNNERPMTRLQLPNFDQSREPLNGSCHLVSSGPWLAVGYPGGVEVFTTKQAMAQMAEHTDDPLEKANILRLAGASREAEQVLASLVTTSENAEIQQAASRQLLALVRVRAAMVRRQESLVDGLKVLDELKPFMVGRKMRLDWYLARVELGVGSQDLDVYQATQQQLYDYMEGR